MIQRIILLLILIISLLPPCAGASEEAALYSKAVTAAKSGQTDFAYMYYNSLARNYPQSKYREKVLFVQGEYCYQLPQYAKSKKALQEFIRDYPDSDGKLFALAYLYKIAEYEKDKTTVEKLKKEILIFKQVGLIFKEFKDYKYNSPLYHRYRAVFHIDNVEFYIGGQLFAKVSY